MSCDLILEQLSALNDGELSADERAAVETHLAGCESCAGERQRIRKLHILAAAIPPEEMPHDLHGQILARLALAGPAPAYSAPVGFQSFLSWLTPFRFAAMGGAACTGVLLAALLANGFELQPHVASTPYAAVAPAAGLKPPAVRARTAAVKTVKEEPRPQRSGQIEAPAAVHQPAPRRMAEEPASVEPAEDERKQVAPAAPVQRPRLARQERRPAEPQPLRQPASGRPVTTVQESIPQDSSGGAAPPPGQPAQPKIAGGPLSTPAEMAPVKERDPGKMMAGMMSPDMPEPMPAAPPEPEPGE